MTDRKRIKRRRFAHEILGLAGLSGLFAGALFLVLVNLAATVAEVYCFEQDIPMTEFDWMTVDRWIFSVGGLLAACAFSLLFLFLLRDRLDYIRKLTAGIEAMRRGQTDCPMPLEGNNELTELADAINYMSAARQQLQAREQRLATEREELVRSLSHDIRTPLTAIAAYSEYLAAEETLSPGERKAHLQMIHRKAEQIRELTDLLLQGAKRNVERFPDARLLMEQLAEEFSEVLEDRFRVETDLSGCLPFAGDFDVQELRRILDNLSSNVRKYADPGYPVQLEIRVEDRSLVLRQRNAILAGAEQEDSYKLGIPGIRRIAQSYDGSASVEQDEKNFSITVIFRIL